MWRQSITPTAKRYTLSKMMLVAAFRALTSGIKGVPAVEAFTASPISAAVRLPLAMRAANFYLRHSLEHNETQPLGNYLIDVLADNQQHKWKENKHTQDLSTFEKFIAQRFSAQHFNTQENHMASVQCRYG